MSTSDQRSAQQGGTRSQQDPQQGVPSQQGANTQPGGQAQQFSPGGGQQGGGAGQYGGSGTQQGSQQEAYSPGRTQQGPSGSLSRRGGGMPALFGGRGSPFDMLRRLDEDMDRLFHQLWGGGRSLMRGRGAESQMWMPQVEMCEQGGKLHVFADLPGLRKEDVKLSIEGDQLILQGERRSSHEEGQQGGDFYHSERSYGSFYRCISLPEGVDPQNVEASFKDGVLDVSFDAPRAPQQQSRQIEIREGGTGQGPGTQGTR